MAHATTPSAIKRYRISFQIRDGDNEYYNDTVMDCDHEPTEEEQVKHVFEQYATFDSEKELAARWPEAWQTYKDGGYLEDLGRDYRHISDIGIEPEPSEIIQLKAVNAELLAACKAFVNTIAEVDEMEHDLDGHDPESCSLCMARAAIVKAEGRTQPSI